MMPDDGTPSAGQGSAGQIPSGQLTTAGTSVSTTTGTAGPPIGATTQTMPANFSQRNDLLDRVPTTAWPLPLNEQQRKQIYTAVMADNSQSAPGATELKPGSFLSFNQTQDLHGLPQAGRPPNGFVVDEITP